MFKYSALIASCLFQVPHGNIREFILEKKKKSIEPINSEFKWLLIEDADWYLTGFPVSVWVHWGLTPPVVSKKNIAQESKGGAPKEAPKDGEEKKGQPGRL